MRRSGARFATSRTPSCSAATRNVLYAETGIDVRGQRFDHLYAADLHGAASVEVGGGHLDITIWKPGKPERVVRKH